MRCAPHNTCSLFQWPPHEILSSYCILSQNHIGQECWRVTGAHSWRWPHPFPHGDLQQKSKPLPPTFPSMPWAFPWHTPHCCAAESAQCPPTDENPSMEAFLTLLMASRSQWTMKTRYKTQSIPKPLNACVLVKHDSIGHPKSPWLNTKAYSWP